MKVKPITSKQAKKINQHVVEILEIYPNLESPLNKQK
jgi:hypothetical protein